mmetsp:Transcript_156872/g.500504  ORF Transcript_156872/g.500504 Transcript_156872/m.500504 type:complete len:83 (+) Transcript_156872:82-330(+)
MLGSWSEPGAGPRGGGASGADSARQCALRTGVGSGADSARYRCAVPFGVKHKASDKHTKVFREQPMGSPMTSLQNAGAGETK